MPSASQPNHIKKSKMSALRTQAMKKSAAFIPRVATYSSATYCTVCHQEEGRNLYNIEEQNSEGRSTSTTPLISSDNDQVVSNGGHVRV